MVSFPQPGILTRTSGKPQVSCGTFYEGRNPAGIARSDRVRSRTRSFSGEIAPEMQLAILVDDVTFPRISQNGRYALPTTSLMVLKTSGI